MNTLTLSIPYPTLEQLINFAGFYAWLSISVSLTILICSIFVFRRGESSQMAGIAVFLMLLPIASISILTMVMVPKIANADINKPLFYTATISSPFVVFYLSALAGIV